jgi:hypothetical protein
VVLVPEEPYPTFDVEDDVLGARVVTVDVPPATTPLGASPGSAAQAMT